MSRPASPTSAEATDPDPGPDRDADGLVRADPSAGPGPGEDQDDDTESTWCSRSSSSRSSSESSGGGGGDELAEAMAGVAAGFPSIGRIAVDSSSEVYIGNNTHFHGAVTLYVPPTTLPALLPLRGAGAGAAHGRRPNALQQAVEQASEELKRTLPIEPAEGPEQPPRTNRWLQILQAKGVVSFLGFAIVSCMIVVVFQMQRNPDQKNNDTTIPVEPHAPATTTLTAFPSTTPRTTTAASPANDPTSPTNATVTSSSSTEPPLVLVSRADWEARPPSGTIFPLQSPVDFLIVHHTGKGSCDTQQACAASTRAIQYNHMELCGWNDIGYNFLVGGDGSVFEGRGWREVGAHTLHMNGQSIGVALIGNFAAPPAPTEAQRRALEQLAALGVRRGALSEEFKLVGACQVRATESPGAVGLQWLRTLAAWSSFSSAEAYCSVSGRAGRLVGADRDCGPTR